MKNFKGILSYEGTRFLGWQKTRMGDSIEKELEKALSVLLRHPVELQSASRTDAGVHAKGQVINFLTSENTLDLSRIRNGVNAILPHDIRLLSLEEASLDFHPTLDAAGKEYIYEICTGSVQSPFLRLFSWHFPYALDIEAMRSASAPLLGTHDFSSFCNERSLIDPDPVCTLQKVTIENLGGGRLQILVQGNRFLYKMMRNLAGSIAYAGCGKIAPESMRGILEARDRRLAGMTAPAHGLYLQRVFYKPHSSS